jgi:hypothetical protein
MIKFRDEEANVRRYHIFFRLMENGAPLEQFDSFEMVASADFDSVWAECRRLRSLVAEFQKKNRDAVRDKVAP